jgi:hypothetical protein
MVDSFQGAAFTRLVDSAAFLHLDGWNKPLTILAHGGKATEGYEGVDVGPVGFENSGRFERREMLFHGCFLLLHILYGTNWVIVYGRNGRYEGGYE